MSGSNQLVLRTNNINLVFCLDWFALIGENNLKEITKIAANYKASHFCINTDTSVSAGLVFIDKNIYKEPLYAAAQIVAHSYINESIALVLELKPNIWWLVAAQNGSVITLSDKVFNSKDEAQNHILDLQNSYPSLKVITANDLETVFSDHVLVDKNLALIQKTNLLKKRLFSYVYFVIAFLIIMAMLIKLLGLFDTNKKLAHIDTQAAWQLAIKNATTAHNLHDVNAIAGILKSIYSIPVAAQGWLLNDAHCLAININWQCSANYYRNHLLASNKGFAMAMPSQWQVSFNPLDQATATWVIDSATINVLEADLKTKQENEVFLFSDLQNIKPALPSVNIQTVKPIHIVAPTDEKGHVLTKPKDLPVLFTREFQVKAPLRSLSLMLLHSQNIAWKKISLVMQSNIKPSLRASAISVTLDGVLYEKN